MCVFENAMISFAHFVFRINVHNNVLKVFKVMQQLMADLFGNLVPRCDRKVRMDGNIEFYVKAMAYPSRTYFANIGDSIDVMYCVDNFIEYFRFNTVEHPNEHGLT